MNAPLTDTARLSRPDLMAKHQAVFTRAQEACRERHCWSPFPDMPGKYPDAAAAQERGRQAFEAHLGKDFVVEQPGTQGAAPRAAEEVSPYTQQALGVRYQFADVDALFNAAEAAMPEWAAASISTRIGTLMEALDTLYRDHIFEIANAVMHTAGQSFNMAYAGSGVNALDRGIEALVYADQAMRAAPSSARWERTFGPATIVLDKTYRLQPRGVAVCFACASFPTWNAWPSMLASLATGNAVIVKPHPATVLPMAITVRVFRQVLAAAGFDPNLVTLALDSTDAPLGKLLVKHPKTAIVDFTAACALASGSSKTHGRRCALPRRPAATRSCWNRHPTWTPRCAAWRPRCACSARRCAPARRTSTFQRTGCVRRTASCPMPRWRAAWPPRSLH
jgi:phenylacetic acid degradation protein paaN